MNHFEMFANIDFVIKSKFKIEVNLSLWDEIDPC